MHAWLRRVSRTARRSGPSNRFHRKPPTIGAHIAPPPQTPAEVRELMNGVAGDGQYTARGGKIDFPLFLRLTSSVLTAQDAEDQLKDAFKVLDKRGDGYIGAEEMRALCQVTRTPQMHAAPSSAPFGRRPRIAPAPTLPDHAPLCGREPAFSCSARTSMRTK